MHQHSHGPSTHTQYVAVGVVGGSDLHKICEQLGSNGMQLGSIPYGCTVWWSHHITPCIPPAPNEYDYMFSENGLVAHKAGDLIHMQSLKTHLGEDKLKKLINFVLHYIADLDIPIKRGTFIEFRNGMINVSPIGRNCSQEERDAFEEYDLKTGVRYVLRPWMDEAPFCCWHLLRCNITMFTSTQEDHGCQAQGGVC